MRQPSAPLVRGGRLLCLAALVLLALQAPGDELSPSEARGREIYLDGAAADGASIRALLGAGEMEVELPGAAAACGGCHGHDGTGRPESGVLPFNITWSFLTRSYGHLHPDGHHHPPFDEDLLRSFLRDGLYPGGRAADPWMPRYEISERDLTDLVAYMKRVGEVRDPGLSETVIRLGTLVPATGEAAQVGTVIRDVLEARFAEVNHEGGIHGRRLELVVHEVSDPDPKAVEAWLAAARPFAVVSPFTPHGDLEIHAALSARGVPVLGPLTLHSLRSFSLNRNVFYLYPGLPEQLEALMEFTDRRLRLSAPRTAVVHPEMDAVDDALGAVRDTARERGWPEVRFEPFPVGGFEAPSVIGALKEAAIDLVVFLGIEEELRRLLENSYSAGWRPYVLAAGSLSGGILADTPPALSERLLLAYPTLPRDRRPRELREVSRLLTGRTGDEPARAHLQAVISAYSTTTLLVEALRKAGRDLGRRELVSELERLYRFETGLTPQITFTANRRVGALGVYVVGPGIPGNDRRTDSLARLGVAWVDMEQ